MSDDTAFLKRPAVAVGVYIALHAALSFALDRAGHQPTFGRLIERHYLLQAVLLVPLTLVGWGLFGAVVHGVVRPQGGLRATIARVAVPLYWPLILLFVLPDTIAYAVAGFDGMVRIVRITAPLAFVVALVATTVTVRGRSWIRSLFAVFLAFVVLGMFNAVWLR